MTTHQPPPPREPDLVDVVLLFLRRWHLLIGLFVLGVLLGIGSSLLRTPLFLAESSFLPATSGGTVSPLARAAALGGFALAAPANGESPSFYAELLGSRAILVQVATAEVPVVDGNTGDTTWVPTPEFFEVESESDGGRIQSTIGALSQAILARTDNNTGMVRVRTITTHPSVSYWLNLRVMELVNDFNLTRRQSRASSERRFVEERLDSARIALRQAEEQLEAWMAANRGPSDSPRIRFTEQRLERRLSEAATVYGALVTAYEEARLDEVRDTPVLTVVDGPAYSLAPAGRPPLISGLLGGFVFGSLGMVIAFILAWIDRERQQNPEQFREVARILRRAPPET